MLLTSLEARNEIARGKVAEFRAGRPRGKLGSFNSYFHEHKNRYPYFGFVEVEVGGLRFVMYSGNDDLIAMAYFWDGPDSFEPMSLITWLEHASEATVIFDVGAFTGVYSLAAAAKNPLAQIHSFEPVRRTYGRLLMNIQANGLAQRIFGVNKGLADTTGEAPINQFRAENVLGNGASIMEKRNPILENDEKINLTSMDEYCRQTGTIPDLIKIDVEGAEIRTLQGMKSTIRQHRPRLLVEVTPETASAAGQLLSESNYVVSVVDEVNRKLTPFSGNVARVANLFALRS